jgi:hypothetical protein
MNQSGMMAQSENQIVFWLRRRLVGCMDACMEGLDESPPSPFVPKRWRPSFEWAFYLNYILLSYVDINYDFIGNNKFHALIMMSIRSFRLPIMEWIQE